MPSSRWNTTPTETPRVPVGYYSVSELWDWAPVGSGLGGWPPTQAPLLSVQGPQQDGSQDDVHLLLVGAHAPL